MTRSRGPNRAIPENGRPQITITKITVIGTIAVTLITVIGAAVNAYITSQAAQAPILIPLQATQTAEAARLTAGPPLQTQPPTNAPAHPTVGSVSSETATPTVPAETPAPTPPAIDTPTSPTETPQPTPAPADTATSPPHGPLTSDDTSKAIARENAGVFCAPTGDSARLDYVSVGESVPVLGRSATGNWLYVQTGRNHTGFVYRPMFDWAGDFSSLSAITQTSCPALARSATPTPTSVGVIAPTSDFIGLEFRPIPDEIDKGHCTPRPGYTLQIQGQGTLLPFDYYIDGRPLWTDDNDYDPLVFNLDYTTDAPHLFVTGRVVARDGRFVEVALDLKKPVCGK